MFDKLHEIAIFIIIALTLCASIFGVGLAYIPAACLIYGLFNITLNIIENLCQRETYSKEYK